MLVTPLFHGSALNWGVTMSVIGGGGIVLARKFSASRFWDQADRAGSTVLWTMGAIVFILLSQELTDTERRAAARLRLIFGAATAARWRQIADRWTSATILDGFGMTETPGTLTEDDCYELPDRYPCVGRPVGGIDLRVVDPETGKTKPDGEVGEIVVRYGQGFADYFNNPEAFAQAVRNGWFHTGDLAYQDETGRVFFVDRLKAIIRRGGENISSLEVEEVLVRHPEVLEAVALPKPHQILGDTVLAALVPKQPGREFALDEIRAFCEGKLAPFKWPEDVRTIDPAIIPRTETGRVKKAMLKKVLGL
jgi:acyl-CoA synthetase (AMP-forming)/AMP-acid ligase II